MRRSERRRKDLKKWKKEEGFEKVEEGGRI